MTTLALDNPTTPGPDDPNAPTLTGTLDADGTVHATAAAFTDFVTAWHRIDPNGTFSPRDLFVNDHAMAYVCEGCAYVYPRDPSHTYPRDPSTDTYALTGWDLVEVTA